MRRCYMAPAVALALTALVGTASAQPSGTGRGRSTPTAPRQFSSRPVTATAFRPGGSVTVRGGRAVVTPRKRNRAAVVVPPIRRPHPRPVIIVRPVRPLPVGGFGGPPLPPGGPAGTGYPAAGNLPPGTVPPPVDPGTNPGPDPNTDPGTDPNTDPGSTDPNNPDPSDPDPPEDPDGGGPEPNL